MSDGHKTESLDGYTVTFHPAFASRCVVHCEDGVREVYKQKHVHKMKDDEKHPKKHLIKLEGGKYGRDIALEIHDPHHDVARITVELYGEGHVPGSPETVEATETLVVYNTGVTCPPHCRDDGGLL